MEQYQVKKDNIEPPKVVKRTDNITATLIQFIGFFTIIAGLVP